MVQKNRMAYRIIKETTISEIEIKKSRFIATLLPVSTGDDVDRELLQIKKKHYKANHNCSAYILGKNSEERHYNDDGEPQGTAGRPILTVIENNEITEVLLVVTRYFGGIKLGSKGLVRAYMEASADVISKASILTIKPASLVSINLDYSNFQKLNRLCEKLDIDMYRVDYLEKIRLELLVGDSIKEKFFYELLEITSGNLDLLSETAVDFYKDGKNIIIKGGR